MAPTVTAPPTGRHTRLPRWLVEVATLAILTIALSPLAFGTFGGDQVQTTLAIGGLVVALLAIAGIAAVRQPRHGWPLALEIWLASLLASFVQVTWFPAGQQEPLAVVALEALVAIVPIAWGVALLGKWLGARAHRAYCFTVARQPRDARTVPIRRRLGRRPATVPPLSPAG